MDCNDNDPNITACVGDACDDGNPATHGETIQVDWQLRRRFWWIPNRFALLLTSAPTTQNGNRFRQNGPQQQPELCTDGISQWVPRFNNPTFRKGASIVSAYIQFEADEPATMIRVTLRSMGSQPTMPQPSAMDLISAAHSRDH